MSCCAWLFEAYLRAVIRHNQPNDANKIKETQIQKLPLTLASTLKNFKVFKAALQNHALNFKFAAFNEL